MKRAGFILLAIGLALTIFTTVKFFTEEKIDEITRDKPHNYSWAPLIGIAIMGFGQIILLKYSKK